jgi:hypothetical protein
MGDIFRGVVACAAEFDLKDMMHLKVRKLPKDFATSLFLVFKHI